MMTKQGNEMAVGYRAIRTSSHSELVKKLKTKQEESGRN